ncbi:cell division protein PerM [Streptomyces sp. NPDC001880]
MTEDSPSLPAEQDRSAVPALALLRGALAAGLGVGSIAVLVLALWISSPASDSDLGGALHAAAGLWLLAHGAELIRADTLSGVPAPVGVVPLLLAVVPVWLVYRAARGALVPDEVRPVPSAVGAFVMVVSGYLLVGAAVAYYGRDGSPAVDPLSLLFPSAVVVTGAAAGVWTATGRPVGPPPSWAPVSLHEALAHGRFRERAGTVWRSAAAGVAVLLGGGALLVAVALVWHAHSAQQAFVQLSGDWAGRVAVLLLALVLVPNAAVWGAAYGLGPGFALGTAATVTPIAFAGRPALPPFPLLAAVPAEGPGTVPNWSAVAVPIAAGATVAWFTVRRAAPPHAAHEEAWSLRETASAAALGAVGCGAGTAVLAAAAGGPLGTRALAEFGPVWWLTGAAALVWTALVGVPGALLLRAWRLREPGGGAWWRRADAVPAQAQGAEAACVAGAPGAVGSGRGAKPEREPGGGPASQPVASPATGAASAPASAPAPPAVRVSAPYEDEDFAPYDFLPTDPWHEWTARPEEAGPSGAKGGPSS